ncbi:hypothetical protein Unana1_07407 [Umbelopsis nana]
MTLQIVIPSSQNSQNQDPQLVLIEFQGTLECNQHDLRGISVGDLEEDNKGKVYLTVGHHKLEGKKTKLSKPLAVISKRSTENLDAMDTDQLRPVTYDIVNILKEKYVFAHRPSLLVQEDLRGLMKV